MRRTGPVSGTIPSMAESPVIHALVRKRAELAGEIDDLNRRITAARARIAHVDGCLALFGYQREPKDIRPVRKRHAQLFQRGQLTRTVLDILREAERPMANREVAAEIVRRVGWDMDDAALLSAVTVRVKDVRKRLNRVE